MQSKTNGAAGLCAVAYISCFTCNFVIRGSMSRCGAVAATPISHAHLLRNSFPDFPGVLSESRDFVPCVVSLVQWIALLLEARVSEQLIHDARSTGDSSKFVSGNGDRKKSALGSGMLYHPSTFPNAIPGSTPPRGPNKSFCNYPLIASFPPNATTRHIPQSTVTIPENAKCSSRQDPQRRSASHLSLRWANER